MVDEEEKEIILKKMKMIDINNMGEYMRRMAIYGYMVEVDMQPLNELTTQLKRIGNNVNQLTKRANETSNIYIDDIEKIGEDVAEIKKQMRILTQQIL